MLLLETISRSCSQVFGKKIWIDHRNDDSGLMPNSELAGWYNILGDAASVVVFVMGNGFLVSVGEHFPRRN